MIALDGTKYVYTFHVAYIKGWVSKHVYSSEVNGKSNVLCFKNIEYYLLCDARHKSSKDNSGDEAKCIIQTTAKIILNDIRSTNHQRENHSSNKKIANIEKSSEWLPKYLNLLMKSIMKSKTKSVSTNQLYRADNLPKVLYCISAFCLVVHMDYGFD